MTSDLHQNHIIGRYSQGQHTLVTSRSQGQSQGHEGRLRFFHIFSSTSPYGGLLVILDRGMQMQGDILSTLLEVADPVSLDTLVFL